MILYLCTRSAGYDEPESALIEAMNRRDVKKILKEEYEETHHVPVDSWKIQIVRKSLKPRVLLDHWIYG